MYHHREKDQVKLTHYDDLKKRAHDSKIVRAKENLQLSYVRPSQRQASDTNQRIKALRQGSLFHNKTKPNLPQQGQNLYP